jgi:hypothetical protein
MIKHLSFNIDLEIVKSEHIVTKALIRLAKLVPQKFTKLIYEQAIEVIYEWDKAVRVERRGFDRVEEMIDLCLPEGVAQFYKWDTDHMVRTMIDEEVERVEEVRGIDIDRSDAEANLIVEIVELKQERQASAAAAIQANLDDPIVRKEMKQRYHDLEADYWRKHFLTEHRATLKMNIETEFEEEMREMATSRAKQMFNLEFEREDGD